MTTKKSNYQVIDSGDYSAGLNGFVVNVTIDDVDQFDLDKEERMEFDKAFKKHLIAFFECYSNGKTYCFTEKDIEELTAWEERAE